MNSRVTHSRQIGVVCRILNQDLRQAENKRDAVLSQALQVRAIIQKKGRVLRSKIAQSFLSLLSWSVVSHCSLLCCSRTDMFSGLFFMPKEILYKPQRVQKNCPLISLPGKEHTKDVLLTADFKFSVPGFHHISMNGVAIQTVTGED